MSACASVVVDDRVAERRREGTLRKDRDAVERDEVRGPRQHDDVERLPADAAL